MVKGGITTGEWSGSDATNQLREVIEKQHEQTAWQSKVMVWLTVAMFVLALVTTAATVVQVWLAMWPPTRC
jgi:hypothetical protein